MQSQNPVKRTLQQALSEEGNLIYLPFITTEELAFNLEKKRS